MASNFSANQFEDSFRPKSLCNWEVPHWYPEHPHRRTTTTKFIANERGHLLPEVARPKSSPWGRFRNTWQLPKRITKEQANEIAAPPVGSSRWTMPDPDKKKNKHYETEEDEEMAEAHHVKVEAQQEPENKIDNPQVEQVKPAASAEQREFSAKESLNNPAAIARQGRRTIRHETLERDDDEH